MEKKELLEKIKEKINSAVEEEKREKEAGRHYTKNFWKGRKTAFQEAFKLVLAVDSQ